MSDESEPPDQPARGEWLRHVFPNLREPLLTQTVHRLQHERFSAGTVIVRQSEDAESLFIIVSGRARVMREERPVASLGSGQFFGEMALLTGEQRSASVVAETDLDVLMLDREGLRDVVERDADSARSTSIDDRAHAGARPLAASHDAWLRTVRSACHVLLASHHAVRSIDVLGRPIHDDDPGSLLRLTDLARRTASEYGIEVRISQVGERPVLHLMTGPVD